MLLVKDREGSGQEAAQGLGEEGGDPRHSATLLGFLTDHQFPKGGDCGRSYPRPPALAQDMVGDPQV